MMPRAGAGLSEVIVASRASGPIGRSASIPRAAEAARRAIVVYDHYSHHQFPERRYASSPIQEEKKKQCGDDISFPLQPNRLTLVTLSFSTNNNMALPLPPGLTQSEVSFVAEMELVTIVPRQRLESINLLSVIPSLFSSLLASLSLFPPQKTQVLNFYLPGQNPSSPSAPSRGTTPVARPALKKTTSRQYCSSPVAIPRLSFRDNPSRNQRRAHRLLDAPTSGNTSPPVHARTGATHRRVRSGVIGAVCTVMYGGSTGGVFALSLAGGGRDVVGSCRG